MHPQQIEILTALKQRLKDKGITYKRLAQDLGLSELTIKRSLTERLTLERLIQICELTGIPIGEVTAAKFQEPDSEPYEMTLEEDQHFAEHVDHYFFLLSILQTDSLSKTAKAFDFSEHKAFSIARVLEKRGFLKIMPKNKLQFPRGSLIRGNSKGALNKKTAGMALQSFLSPPTKEFLIREFTFAPLSESSKAEILNELRRISDRVNQLGFRDHSLPEAELQPCGFVAAFRPWVYDPAEDYRTYLKRSR